MPRMILVGYASMPAVRPAPAPRSATQHYAETDDAPVALREVVDAVLPLACAELAIPIPTVKWFRAVPESRVLNAFLWPGKHAWQGDRASGFVSCDQPNVIWFNADTRAESLARTVRHEAKHVEQHVGFEAGHECPPELWEQQELEAHEFAGKPARVWNGDNN